MTCSATSIRPEKLEVVSQTFGSSGLFLQQEAKQKVVSFYKSMYSEQTTNSHRR